MAAEASKAEKSALVLADAIQEQDPERFSYFPQAFSRFETEAHSVPPAYRVTYLKSSGFPPAPDSYLLTVWGIRSEVARRFPVASAAGARAHGDRVWLVDFFVDPRGRVLVDSERENGFSDELLRSVGWVER
jgi:hypothetical protein